MPEVSEVSLPTKSNSVKVNILQSGGDDGFENHGKQVHFVDDL